MFRRMQRQPRPPKGRRCDAVRLGSWPGLWGGSTAAPSFLAKPMPINISCPHCGVHAQVPSTASGKTVKCFKCRKDVPIPFGDYDPLPPTNETEPADPVPSEEDDAAPAPQGRKRKRRPREDEETFNTGNDKRKSGYSIIKIVIISWLSLSALSILFCCGFMTLSLLASKAPPAERKQIENQKTR